MSGARVSFFPFREKQLPPELVRAVFKRTRRGPLTAVEKLLVRAQDAGRARGRTLRVGSLKATLGPDFTIHSLRRAYRTGPSELGIQTKIAGLMIGHARAGVVGLYDRSMLMTAQRSAQDAWEAHVELVTSAGTVRIADVQRAR